MFIMPTVFSFEQRTPNLSGCVPVARDWVVPCDHALAKFSCVACALLDFKTGLVDVLNGTKMGRKKVYE